MLRTTLRATWRPAHYPKQIKHLGDHIRKKRIELGWQVCRLASELATDAGSVAAWEKGRRHPSLRKLPKVLRFLGYDPRCPGTTVGERLRRHRTARGMSHRELARVIGVDASTVDNWERGEHEPSPRCQRMLARFLSD